MPTITEPIAQLEAAIAAQETLRPTLGDAAVDAVIASLRTQLESLRAQQPPTDKASLHGHLTRLQQADLIRLLADDPEVAYIFKHALTQDAAYESLLMTERKELHRKVGGALEAIFTRRLDAMQSLIGEHYFHGEAWEKAVEYLIKAGDAATRTYAHAEARLLYAKALQALSHLADSEAHRRLRVDSLIKQVEVSLRADGPDRNLARLQEAEALVQTLPEDDQTPNRLRMARIHYWMGHAHLHRNQSREAIQYLRQVLAVAQEFHDEELLAIPSGVIGRAMAVQGQFGKAEPLLAQAIPLLEKVGNWHEWTLTVGSHALCLSALGHYTEAIAEAGRAVAHTTAIHQTLSGIRI